MSARTIVHLSDLHFGALNEATIKPLAQALAEVRPDAVVISGDLTQRARPEEFEQARAFLRGLAAPHIVVPGNHDVPLYSARRFVRPLARYRRYVADDLNPFWSDGTVAIAGINTARSWTVKGGRVNDRQIAGVSAAFDRMPPETVRIITAHHPFDLPDGASDRHLVGRAHRAMAQFARSRVDVFLTGHLHASRTSSTAERYGIQGYAALVIQAGTATSRRGRGEANAFNVVHLDGARIGVERFEWAVGASAFSRSQREDFVRGDAGWMLDRALTPSAAAPPAAGPG